MAKCIDCKTGCKEATESGLNAWKCELTGIWVYKTLPEGMRPATVNDLNPDGLRVIGLRYLLLSSISKMYEAYTLNDCTDLPNLIRFVNDGRCWVKK